MSEIAIREQMNEMGQDGNGMITEINGMRFWWKILLNSVH